MLYMRYNIYFCINSIHRRRYEVLDQNRKSKQISILSKSPRRNRIDYGKQVCI